MKLSLENIFYLRTYRRILKSSQKIDVNLIFVLDRVNKTQKKSQQSFLTNFTELKEILRRGSIMIYVLVAFEF